MSGWYQNAIAPHIVRLGCGCSFLDEYRRRVAPQARGRVLEIGIGAGANLPFYDRALVSSLIGVEPSPRLRKAAARSSACDILEDLVDARAEALPFPAASFDTVVSTFTLCSVDDPCQTLAEARRVLVPGGRLLFCEHGLAPDPKIQRWQRRLEPVWTPALGGCRLTRDIRSGIAAHFMLLSWTGRYHGGKPNVAGWMEWGEALPD